MPEYKVRGFEELQRNLALLPQRMETNVFRASVRGGAREMINISKRNLGGGYRTLKKSLKIKLNRTRRGMIKMQVHPERGKTARYNGWYAHIVEFGSYKHPSGWDIYPWRSKTERKYNKRISGKKALSYGGSNVYGKAHHPAIKPTRFMTRAMKQERAIIDAMIKAGQKSFNRQIVNLWLHSNR